ncbi:thiopurine S-methyltransferase [Robiginitalea myxolifaciens]|uniref:Thiopurine S-methyltransferase n=1 Tax=Robiginitalea myxolifaciens TaxID=400055 RepID=A0A1I6H658_9FLAO|nr:methyltransferase domain-containing protein [Robiginitalea myxolifaciens]SFR49781.1 thiopurine S-methyltransferase [Robiginitalea myxolifaciens]
MKINSEDYWSERYRNGSTGWDMGGPAPALTAYADQLTDKSIRILLPGAGRAYEAEYLFRAGFTALTVIDIAAEPLADLKARVPEFPESQLIPADFFEFQGGPFDLILEHTFFCALPPALRSEYVRKMAALLAPDGKLAGLFFSFPLTEQGPPFGGSAAEYRALFSPYFEIKTLEQATNSIPPRMGNELFFIFELPEQQL